MRLNYNINQKWKCFRIHHIWQPACWERLIPCGNSDYRSNERRNQKKLNEEIERNAFKREASRGQRREDPGYLVSKAIDCQFSQRSNLTGGNEQTDTGQDVS